MQHRNGVLGLGDPVSVAYWCGGLLPPENRKERRPHRLQLYTLLFNERVPGHSFVPAISGCLARVVALTVRSHALVISATILDLSSQQSFSNERRVRRGEQSGSGIGEATREEPSLSILCIYWAPLQYALRRRSGSFKVHAGNSGDMRWRVGWPEFLLFR